MRFLRRRKLAAPALLLLAALTLLLLLGLVVSAFWILWFDARHTNRIYEPRVVLWWTTMPPDYNSVRYCGFGKYAFTADRRKLAEAKAILFYGSDLNITDWPLPRKSHQIWALLHEESPRNVPYMPHDATLHHFNLTSTFSRYSDFPLTTQYLPDIRNLTDPRYLLAVGAKDISLYTHDLASIVFLQSDCDTMAGREDYVRQLMKHIKIDSFGHCLQNRMLPTNLREGYLNKLYSPQLNRFLSRYKFILSYENGVCDDYITEKYWRPLIIGAIPIYFGSPTIRDWAPNEKSAIYIEDFESPKALADFINNLDDNATEYNTYLSHKYNQLQPISNERLTRELAMRRYSMSDENLFGTFECFVGHRLYLFTEHNKRRMATKRHYNCSLPLVYPPMDETQLKRDWESVMAVGKCQAEILDALLQHNERFTQQHFNALLEAKVRKNECN